MKPSIIKLITTALSEKEYKIHKGKTIGTGKLTMSSLTKTALPSDLSLPTTKQSNH